MPEKNNETTVRTRIVMIIINSGRKCYTWSATVQFCGIFAVFWSADPIAIPSGELIRNYLSGKRWRKYVLELWYWFLRPILLVEIRRKTQGNDRILEICISYLVYSYTENADLWIPPFLGGSYEQCRYNFPFQKKNTAMCSSTFISDEKGSQEVGTSHSYNNYIENFIGCLPDVCPRVARNKHILIKPNNVILNI